MNSRNYEECILFLEKVGGDTKEILKRNKRICKRYESLEFMPSSLTENKKKIIKFSKVKPKNPFKK